MITSFSYDIYTRGDYDDVTNKKGTIEFRKSPLFIAVENNRKDIVEILLSNSKINVNDMSTCECSYYYYYEFSEHVETKDDYMCEDEDVEYKTALYEAVNNKNIEIIKLLSLCNDIDCNIKCKEINNLDKLTEFIRNLNDDDDHSSWISEYKIEIDCSEQTSIELAIYNKDNEIIKTLLSFPKVDLMKNNVMHYAVKSGNMEIINILFSNPYFNKKVGLSNQLQNAIDNNRMDIFNFLLDQPEININENLNGYTPLKASVKNKNMMAFKMLLNQQNIDINDNSGGMTALKIAVENKNMDALKILLNRPEIDINDNSGNKTALKIAVNKYNLDIVKLLVNHPKIEYNLDKLFDDISSKKLDIIRFLIDTKK